MARASAGLPAGIRLSDRISLGVVAGLRIAAADEANRIVACGSAGRACRAGKGLAREGFLVREFLRSIEEDRPTSGPGYTWS